jgi:hypothetical protein
MAAFLEQVSQSPAMERPITAALEMVRAFLDAAGREVPVWIGSYSIGPIVRCHK